MDPRMMNEWLKAQAQKQQLSTRSIELKRQGMAINEQLNAQEEKFAKEHKHMLANMIKQYGKDKGTRVFYASVRNAVKKLNEDAMVKDVVVNPKTEPKVPGDIPKPSTVSDSGRMGRNGVVPQIGDRRGITDINPNSGGMSDYDSGEYEERGDGDLKNMTHIKRPQPLPQPVAKPNSNPGPKNVIDRMTGRGPKNDIDQMTGRGLY